MSTCRSTVTSLGARSRVDVLPGRRAVFTGAGMLGFAAFGATGVFSSVGALIVRDDLGIRDVFVGGMGTFAVFAAAAQLAGGRFPPRLGAACYVLGMVATTVSIANPSLWLFLVAAAATGVGAGALFKTGLSHAAGAAAPASRAGVLSVFLVVAYLGMGLPSVGYGMLVCAFGTTATMAGLGAVLVIVAVAGPFTIDIRSSP